VGKRPESINKNKMNLQTFGVFGLLSRLWNHLRQLIQIHSKVFLSRRGNPTWKLKFVSLGEKLQKKHTDIQRKVEHIELEKTNAR